MIHKKSANVGYPTLPFILLFIQSSGVEINIGSSNYFVLLRSMRQCCADLPHIWLAAVPVVLSCGILRAPYPTTAPLIERNGHMGNLNPKKGSFTAKIFAAVGGTTRSLNAATKRGGKKGGKK
jgi:hypothetical protein